MHRRQFLRAVALGTFTLGVDYRFNCIIRDGRHLLFLGTCAALDHEGEPVGPRDIHGYAMLYVPPNSVIDFAVDARDKMRYWGVDERAIGNILITHSHHDHFDPPTIIAFARDRWNDYRAKTSVFSSQTVVQTLRPAVAEAEADGFVTVTEVKVGDRIQLAEGLAAVVLPSSHWTAPTPVYFLLEFYGREILYAVDSSAFTPETIECLKERHLDAVITDCTFLDQYVDPKKSGHMNYNMVCEQMAKLRARGIADASTPCYITHMALRSTADYKRFSPGARRLGLRMAYDGMSIYVPTRH